MKNPTRRDIDHFKKAILMDYNRLILDKADCNGRLFEIEDQINSMFGVKGVHYGGIPGSSDPHYKELKRLGLIDKSKKIEQKLAKIDQKIAIIDTFCRFADTKISEAAFRIYCLETSTYKQEAENMFISESTLKRKINQEIYNFLKVDTQSTFFL